MEWVTLKAEPRNQTGTTECIRLRTKGFIPAVLYGRREPNQLLQVSQKEFVKTWSRGHRLLNLDLQDKTEKVIVKEVQYDSIRDMVVHVDFNRLAMDEKISVDILLVLKGQPKGIKEGGVLQQNLKMLAVKCLPNAITEKIEVAVDNLELNQMIRVKDLILPTGIEAATDAEVVVVAVHLPKVEEVTPATEPGAAEPEVITAKKEETTEEATGKDASSPGKEEGKKAHGAPAHPEGEKSAKDEKKKG
ncbi:MAG: 50S ribosomal protein L25 [Planctomycetota bacterium]